jgi:hypothetical protein
MHITSAVKMPMLIGRIFDNALRPDAARCLTTAMSGPGAHIEISPLKTEAGSMIPILGFLLIAFDDRGHINVLMLDSKMLLT